MEHAKSRKIYRTICFLGMFVLILYPLRHVNKGIDLLDGGYGYANFCYCSPETMDSMWYFATWLANHVGSLLTRLPFGSTMLGMNVYTGLLISIMASASYLFYIKCLQMPNWIAFLGEMLAISLCWVPTAALYNYLTYALLLLGTCLLYRGLVTEKSGCLIAAGVVLGLNVGVRFPNLAQTGFILAVWFYGLCRKKKISVILRDTGFCILGYAAALGSFLVFLSVKYGFSNYAEAVARLFQMTENAVDYAPGHMLVNIVQAYFENDSTFWMKRFLLLFGAGLMICLLLPKSWVRAKKCITILLTLAGMAWFVTHRYYSRDYATYEAVYIPCVMVIEMAIVLAFKEVFSKSADKERRLFAILMLLTLFITPIGSNNAMYSNINNLFLVAPGFLWMLWEFCKSRKEMILFPAKCVMCAGTFLLVVQTLRFGAVFVYEEATGGRNMTTQIEEIPVLHGMKTNGEKAAVLTGLYRYLSGNNLMERECILYGEIPGVAYYMGLTPALNIWGDLRSYSPEVMEGALEQVKQEMHTGKKEPVVILEARCADYVETRDGTGVFREAFMEEKMILLCDFLETCEYKRTYGNAKFVVYESGG